MSRAPRVVFTLGFWMIVEDVVLRERARQAPPDPRAIEERRGILLDEPLAQEELEEPADRRELPRARPRAEPTTRVGSEELRDVALGHLLGARVLSESRRERVQIARVALERVLREPALDAEVIEVRVDAAREVHVFPQSSVISPRGPTFVSKDRKGRPRA